MAKRIRTGIDGRVYLEDYSAFVPNAAQHSLLGKSWQEIMKASTSDRKSFADSHPFEYENAQREYYRGKGVPLELLTAPIPPPATPQKGQQ